jgi:anti-anti-sigma factor
MLKVRAKNLETVTILFLQGQIVTGETDTLRSVVQSLCDTRVVLVDLALVSKIDAHGLGVMLEMRELMQARGIRFELMRIRRPLTRVLEMTHLDAVFQIASGVEFFPAVSPERRMPLEALKSCA